MAIFAAVVALGEGTLSAAPAAQEMGNTMNSIAVTVPDAGWRLRIERVLERENDVWVLAQLHREPGPAAQVIRRLQVAIPVELPPKPLRVFIAGKTWAWPNKEPYEFVKSLDEVTQRAGEARVLYAAPAEAASKRAR